MAEVNTMVRTVAANAYSRNLPLAAFQAVLLSAQKSSVEAGNSADRI